jgi:hypothetical protein
MLRKTATEHRPLPVAPRPFEAEVLGGWIGRVASRYKMSVLEFAAAHDLELRLPDTGAWLLMQMLPARSIAALAQLTRISRKRIKSIAVPAPAVNVQPQFRYCARCAFVNPLDVTAPIWRREWFDPAMPMCPTHVSAFSTLSPRLAMACENLDQLLSLVSRHEQLRTRRQRRASGVR